MTLCAPDRSNSLHAGTNGTILWCPEKHANVSRTIQECFRNTVNVLHKRVPHVRLAVIGGVIEDEKYPRRVMEHVSEGISRVGVPPSHGVCSIDTACKVLTHVTGSKCVLCAPTVSQSQSACAVPMCEHRAPDLQRCALPREKSS